MQITPDRQLLAAAGIYWAFQKHMNSEVQKLPSQMCFLLSSIISKLMFPKRCTKMIDSSKIKHKCQLAFEFQNSCVFENRGKTVHFLGMDKSSFSINGHNAMILLVVMHHSEFALLA